MRLISMSLKNFRCYNRDIRITFEALTALIGKNDSGKSTLFDALDIFFNEAKMDPDDLSIGATSRKITISCIFTEIPDNVVIDDQNTTSLASEYLLNNLGQLEIVKEYPVAVKSVSPFNVYAKCNHPSKPQYDDLLSLSISDLKKRASDLAVNLDSISLTKCADIRRAIWKHADDLMLNEKKIELKKEDSKKLWDSLKNYLPAFALFKSDRKSSDQDDEAQDPMKSAIKEGTSEVDESFNTDIRDKVIRKVQSIADLTVDKVKEISPDIASTLKARVEHKKLDTLFSVSLTGDGDIPVNKRGSGVRRLVLLAFFRAKLEMDAAKSGINAIYAIEEPETSQHPSNQLLLLDTFKELSSTPGCQVFISTHEPLLARQLESHTLRYVTRNNDRVPIINSGNEEETLLAIIDSLGIIPDHDIRVFVGVEGRNDIAFLNKVSKVLSKSDSEIESLEDAENKGSLLYVPLGGSSLDLWVSRLKGLNRKEFYIFDRDTPPPTAPTYKKQADEINQRANCLAVITSKRELENYIPLNLIKAIYPEYEGNDDDFEDVPELFAKAVHEQSESNIDWDNLSPDNKEEKIRRAKKRLNGEVISGLTSEMFDLADHNEEIRNFLKQISAAMNSV